MRRAIGMSAFCCPLELGISMQTFPGMNTARRDARWWFWVSTCLTAAVLAAKRRMRWKCPFVMGRTATVSCTTGTERPT
jgi:hypothetical protein